MILETLVIAFWCTLAFHVQYNYLPYLPSSEIQATRQEKGVGESLQAKFYKIFVTQFVNFTASNMSKKRLGRNYIDSKTCTYSVTAKNWLDYNRGQ